MSHDFDNHHDGDIFEPGHRDLTDYTGGANFARSVGLPDHIKDKAYLNDKVEVNLDSIRKVKGPIKRFKLHRIKWKIERCIDANARIYKKNKKKLAKITKKLDKYRQDGMITGFRVKRLNNLGVKYQTSMNNSARYLNDRLYHNYIVYDKFLTGRDVEEIKKDEYYNAHIKDTEETAPIRENIEESEPDIETPQTNTHEEEINSQIEEARNRQISIDEQINLKLNELKSKMFDLGQLVVAKKVSQEEYNKYYQFFRNVSVNGQNFEQEEIVSALDYANNTLEEMLDQLNNSEELGNSHHR